MIHRRVLQAYWALFLTVLLFGNTAAAQELSTEECLSAHEASQIHRANAELLEARAALLQCSSASCPSVIQNDCSRWFSEVQEETPTIIISARRGSEDLTTVKVFVDGEMVADTLDGREIRLDPGQHTVKVEPEGEEAQERTLLVVKGARQRSVVFTYEDPNAVPPPGSAVTTQAPPPVEMYRPVQPITYVFLGVAGAGVLAGTGLGIWGLTENNSLKNDCAPFCTDKQKSGVDAILLGADIGFGVAVAGGIGALVTYLIRPEVPVEKDEDGKKKEEARKPAFQVAVTPRSVGLSLGGQF